MWYAMTLIALLLFSAAGCGLNYETKMRFGLFAGETEIYPLSPQQIELIKSAVLRTLKDPDSARFGPISAGKDHDELIVIGS